MVQPLETRLLMARVQGIDVSQWQGTMNWTTAYNAGNRFTFAKATQGTTAVDPQFTTNRTAAKNAGLLIGFYHFATPDNITDANADGRYDDAVAEAEWFYSNAGAYMGTGYLKPVLDLESNPGGLTNTQLSKFANDFCWRMQALSGQDPIIYCNTNYAANVYNSTVNVHDLWIANWNETSYGHPVNGTGNPPSGVWPAGSWDFWQYSADGNGQGAANGAQSSAIDLDVFNGSDINLLKQNFMVGAPDIPTGPSPANGATNVSPLNFLFNWNDSPGATRYDIYLDNMTTPAASNLTSSQWNAGNIPGGAHTWKVVAKPASNDDDTHVSSAVWSFTASSLPLPGVPSGGTPNNVFVISKPVILDWADTPNASTYDIYLGTSPTPTYTNLTASQSPSLNPADGVRLWRVVAKNATGNTNGPQWQYTLDTVAPAANYGAQTPTSGTTFLDFTVTYTDATSGVDFTSLDSSDIYVTGPNSYSQSATLMSLDANANGSTRIATYRIAAPGGTWDMADNGTYTVNQNASQVKDVAGGFRAAGAIGIFTLGLAQPIAYQLGSVLHLDFSATGAAIVLSLSGGTYTASSGAQTLNFSGVTAVVADGTSDADVLQLSNSIPVPLTFANGAAGNDALEVNGGTLAIDSDLGAGAPNLLLKVAGGATVTIDSTQHLRGLHVTGQVNVTAGDEKVIVTRELQIFAPAGRIDLADNDLVIDYDAAGPSPIGAASGGTYSGVAGWIQAGSNGGAWDGASGITTTQGDAAGGLTTLGIGEASGLFGLEPGDTALFGAETVDATSVIVKYTYAGDANLDGFISGDDYSTIDFYVGTSADGYTYGDFNYDGLVSGDDYSTIDFNFSAQGAPL
ncbi:MAG: lysozyme [Phycisphaerales bacterium]|jgi:GH25 family lysozyme M1 (1,4-beta-N-acetylmuramidase)|nr:lysozyme [Phycisphaerales bacterium]